jgi:hypothetical protein
VAAGVGGSLSVQATVQGQVAQGRVLFSYMKPEVTAVLAANCPSLGGRISTVFGNFFGLTDHTIQNRVGGSGAEITSWLSDTTSSLKISASIGDRRVHVLSVGVQVSSLLSAYSFDTPTISCFSNHLPKTLVYMVNVLDVCH